MPTYLYVVVDDKGRVVKSYTTYSWAEQKAKTRKNYRIVAFVNTENVRMLEVELYIYIYAKGDD